MKLNNLKKLFKFEAVFGKVLGENGACEFKI